MKTTIKQILAVAWLAAGSATLHAAGFWQPLCPDGAVCSTATRAFVGGGRVLLQSTDSEKPSQWVDIASLAATPTRMRDVSLITAAGDYVGASGPRVIKYDATGNFLYSANNGSVESWIVFESHATPLGPALDFAGTTPPTLINGLAAGSWLPTIYLTRDEGRTTVTQQANVAMSGERTSFVAGIDGQRVWVVPGPVTPGLWQTPVATGATLPDFTHLSRLDDGSFPTDVFQLRVIGAGPLLPGGYAIALADNGMYVSLDRGRSWTRGAFGGAVDDAVFPTASPDIQVLAARSSVFISRDRGATWSELGHGLPADQYLLSATGGNLVADGVGGVFGCRALDCTGPAFGKLASVGSVSAQVTEFYNTVLDHFFMTADESEKAAIRAGAAGPGWVDTNQSFWAWPPSVTRDSAFVCRFYGDLVKGPNSHFYSASTDECRALLTLQDQTPASEPRWNSEGYAFKVSLPVAGRCDAGLVPVWRAYNDGFAHGIDSNHRYALDHALLAPLVARGWKDEGLAFCVPATAGN
jgi:hypothetical protein